MLRVRGSGRYWPAPPPPPPFMVSVRRWPRHCRATRHAATSGVSLPPPGDGRLRGEETTTTIPCPAAGFDPCHWCRCPQWSPPYCSTSVGQGWADCSSMSGPCPGLGGRRMGGSKTTRFSVDGSTQLFLAHTKTGELLLYRTCVTLVLEHAELQELVPGIRVRDVNDDQSGSVSSTFVSWSPYFHLFGGENRGGRIRCLSLVIENQRGEHRTVPWDLGPHAACSRRVATLLVERMFRFTTYWTTLLQNILNNIEDFHPTHETLPSS